MIDTYAEILVTHAVGLRRGQDVFIRCPYVHHDFAVRIGCAAYRAGARYIHYRIPDPDILDQLIRHGTAEQIALYHEEANTYLAEVLKRNAASICLVHDYDTPEWITALESSHAENLRFYLNGMGRGSLMYGHYMRMGMIAHTAAPAATPRWAKKLFPDLSESDALETLWRYIFRFAHVDQRDHRDALEEALERQRLRTDALNALSIQKLHITGGGNDLIVHLSEKAKWVGGSLTTQSGQVHFPNFPSSEIFTLPDYRLTEGTLTASMPFRLYNYAQISDLVLTFRDGAVVDFGATEGKEAFGSWIETDAGARCLGEIGLVGNDSLVGQSGLFFDCPHFDENAASHIALGLGVPAISGGERMTEKELASYGYNHSDVHTDIMFGSPEVTVVATRSNGREVVLLEGGVWRIPS